MMPLPPHNIVNILSPHLGIPLPLFWLSTFFGIFAVSVIHTSIGNSLDQMTSPEDFHLFSLRNCLLLTGVCIAVLIPVAVKKFGKVESLEAADDGETGHGAVYLEEGEGEEDAQRLPDSFRSNLVGAAAFESDDEDELPRRNLDTGNILATGAGGGNPGVGGMRDVDAEESFPSWRDARSDSSSFDGANGNDDDDAFEGARGGVFSDRAINGGNTQSSATGAGAKGGNGKGGLKAWLGSNTGIKL